MSDNLASQEMRRRLIIFLRIPNETWTDVLKMLPRRILFQKIAPVCYRLKEISDKNVKSIHIVENADRFDKKLAENDPEAIQQVKHLAGNKCNLAEYFRLSKFMISDEKIKAVLHHSMDLLRGCKITFDGANHQWNIAFLDKCLSILGMIKPIVIRFGWHMRSMEINKLWMHPTVRNCNRIVIQNSWTNIRFISDWLHHKPQQVNVDVNMDGSAANQQVRCVIGAGIRIWTKHELNWLISNCIENLKQSRHPTDHRQFAVNFACWAWEANTFEKGFQRIENNMTGEVLMLERKPIERIDTFQLRRCLVQEEAGGMELFAKMFKSNKRKFHFNLEEVKAVVSIDK